MTELTLLKGIDINKTGASKKSVIFVTIGIF